MVRSLVNLPTLAGLASASAGTLAPRRQNDGTPAVDISALNRNVSATAGTGAVSAAGTLSPFGGIGVGCGINWQEGTSFGGESRPGGRDWFNGSFVGFGKKQETFAD